MSSRIFLQSFTFLFHFLFLPSTQLPHTCSAFHMLMTQDKTTKHDGIGTSGLAIQDGLQCYSMSSKEHSRIGPPSSTSLKRSSTIPSRRLSGGVSVITHLFHDLYLFFFTSFSIPSTQLSYLLSHFTCSRPTTRQSNTIILV